MLLSKNMYVPYGYLYGFVRGDDIIFFINYNSKNSDNK